MYMFVLSCKFKHESAITSMYTLDCIIMIKCSDRYSHVINEFPLLEVLELFLGEAVSPSRGEDTQGLSDTVSNRGHLEKRSHDCHVTTRKPLPGYMRLVYVMHTIVTNGRNRKTDSQD